MLKGAVNLQATMRGNGVTFTSVEFKSNEPGVEKVVIDAPDGNEIRATVHFASVASGAEAQDAATKVTTAALNRLAFHRGLVIENARITSDSLSLVDLPPGVVAPAAASAVFASDAAKVVTSISPATVKSELEQAAPPGEHNYGLFRSARLTTSPVEEFMVLYHILLMLYNEQQRDVDAFIVREEPAVLQTPDPRPGTSRMETVYTRLRNELGHKRPGVNLDNTRSEMAGRLDGLRTLTKRTIELHP